jgi:hypothetical protein
MSSALPDDGRHRGEKPRTATQNRLGPVEGTSQGKESLIVRRPSVWGSNCSSAACPRTGLLPPGLAACLGQLALVSCVLCWAARCLSSGCALPGTGVKLFFGWGCGWPEFVWYVKWQLSRRGQRTPITTRSFAPDNTTSACISAFISTCGDQFEMSHNINS